MFIIVKKCLMIFLIELKIMNVKKLQKDLILCSPLRWLYTFIFGMSSFVLMSDLVLKYDWKSKHDFKIYYHMYFYIKAGHF